MKIFSSSPYATFNSKEWNDLISKNDKFVNAPIRIQKKYFKTHTFEKIEKTKILKGKSELHKQMQIIFV
tara:strand:- start:310 stop:516 length:207 start_codon:yes stop_codon:yes gene_type:complete